MSDLEDFTLRSGPGDPPPGDDRGPGLWVVLVVVALIVGAAVGYLVLRTPRTQPAPVTEAPAPAPPAADDLALPEPEPVELPALDRSDALVRDLARTLSEHPRLAAWLATNRLIRTFTVTVDNVANGASPVQHVRFLRPDERFVAVPAGEDRFRIDPRSYRRYDGAAEVVASIDAGGAAQLYSTLRPLIAEAYRELGHPEGGFDRTLERAINRLLETPVVEGEIPLEPLVLTYAFADPRLEGLSPVQKQFLGMGPRNVRLVQGKLREIALALGIPDERLARP